MIKLKSLFRRGGGQSGSPSSTSSVVAPKQVVQISPSHSVGIKTSASTSSLDRIAAVNSGSASADLGATRKLSKSNKQSSKDKLNDLLKGGSKEKLFDDKKELKKLQKQQQKQMQQVSQQSSNNIYHPSAGARHSPGEQRPERSHSKDIDSAGFNGMQDIKHKQTMQELRQLQQENSTLEMKIRELTSSHNEMIQLRKDVQKLQQTNDVKNLKLGQLEEENELLRDRMRNVVPLSENEKAQHRMHSSAPASIAVPNFTGNNETDANSDWDKQSAGSEVAVACLQDKIIQMEETHLMLRETHYSTNEELQATLHELADLQNQVLELQNDNERLSDEKDVIFQSLCRQTEKLEDSRSQFETLQKLLLRDPDQQDSASTEREQKLVDLLKGAQEEREGLLMKLEEMNSDLNELKKSLESSQLNNQRLKERISVLESTVDASTADRKEIERELGNAKEESSAKQIEISRLTTLLENARSKIDELEQDRALGDKSDLGELLDGARKEKDNLEVEIATLQEQLSKSQNETLRLRDNLAGATEECKVTRNNAKCALSDLEYKCEQMQQEKNKIQTDYQQLIDTISELQVQSKCLVEDKAQMESLLSQTQCHLGDTERQLSEKCEQLQNEMSTRKQENEEWEQFQKDLLISVRVANDFKTEAQLAHEQLAVDNKLLREKIRGLESQIEKLNKLVASSNESQQSLLSTVQHEMAQRRIQKSNGNAVKNGTNGTMNPMPVFTGNPAALMTRQDSRLSVKSLIESIENTSKQTKEGSQSGSMTSLNSLTAMDQQIDSQSPSATEQEKQQNTLNNNSITSNNNGVNGSQRNRATTPQKNEDQFYSSILSSHSLSHSKHDYVRRNSYGDISERKDPLNALVKNGGSKRNALLKWCQNKTIGYRNIDITNFSSSWNDGLALCALMHSYLPDIPYDELTPQDKKRNFSLAFDAAEKVGINTTLNITEMCQNERPDWQIIMSYVTEIYKHFETQP